MPAPELLESPIPQINPPRHDTREDLKALVDEDKKAKRRKPLRYTLFGTVVTLMLGAGGYGSVKASSAETTTTRTAKSLGTLDERSRSQQRTIERHETEISNLEKAQTNESKRNAVFRAEQRATNQVILDALRVPKSKRPKIEAEEEEP